MRKALVITGVLLVILMIALPVAACAPPDGSTPKGGGTENDGWSVYCQPDGNIYVDGRRVTVTIGSITPAETWYLKEFITGPSPNWVTVTDDFTGNTLFNELVDCGGTVTPPVDLPVDPPDDPVDFPVCDYGDPADMIRITADSPASPIVIYQTHNDDCIMVSYGYNGTYLGALDFSQMPPSSIGGLMASMDGPGGSRADVYYMGINDDASVQIQINVYNPDETYTEFHVSVECTLADAPDDDTGVSDGQ